MRRIQWSLAVALIAGIVCMMAPNIALAQEEAYPEARYTVIHFDQVEPANTEAYEENSAAWAAAFKEAGLGEEYAWRMYSGPNFDYAFLSDMPNFATLDKSEEQQKVMAEAIGAEKMAELIAGVAATSHYSEITKDVFQEKKAELEVEEAKVGQRLDQVTATITQGEEDIENALKVANHLPVLWSNAGTDDRRALLEAVFVRFVVDRKRVVDFEVRPPYSWLVRWTPEQVLDRVMPKSSASVLEPVAD